jgi:hypothetical protein
VQRLTAVRPELAPAAQLRESIDSFLTYVEKNAAATAHLLRSGVGTDPRRARSSRAPAAPWSTGPAEHRPRRRPPLVRLVIRGWIGFSEGVTLDWADRRDVPRRDVLRLLATAFENTRR